MEAIARLQADLVVMTPARQAATLVDAAKWTSEEDHREAVFAEWAKAFRGIRF